MLKVSIPSFLFKIRDELLRNGTDARFLGLGGPITQLQFLIAGSLYHVLGLDADSCNFFPVPWANILGGLRSSFFLFFFSFSSLQIVTNIRHALSTMDVDVGKAILARGCLERN
ncbi:hypothetical protein HDV64DRAFT_136489 [Trichoderma sp. TUCIM 5745]